MKPTLNPVLHELAVALRFVGLRDRLRCPRCKAVGTWKPHGARLDREDKRKVRRWMCKWCGYYIGPEGVRQAEPRSTSMVWELRGDDLRGFTPQETMERNYTYRVWPWRG